MLRYLVVFGVVAGPAWVLAQDAPPRIVLTPEARAQVSEADKVRAEALNTEATNFYKTGRYKEAIEKFQRANEINPDPELVFRIAVAYQQLESWQECVNYMDRYLESAPTGPKRDRADNTRKSCDARIERDQQLIIDSDPKGARVFLDDRAKGVQGQTPFSNYVRPGSHKVWIELDGYDTVEQTIQVQTKEPFRLNLVMRKMQNRGWLFVDSILIDARVYIDGKNVGLTPFQEPLGYGAGLHQVVVERDGYTRFTKQVNVNKGQVTTVDAYMVRTDNISTWRTGLGWTAEVLGALCIGGGVVAFFLAEDEYNDTDDFDKLAFYEKLGYGLGGGLMAVGTGLLIWDAARDVVDDKDRNPGYKKPVRTPTARGPVHFGVHPTGFAFGFEF